MKEEIQDKIEKGWIHSEMIFDVLAVGPEKSKKTLEDHIKNLGNVKGIEIYESKVEEPLQHEEYKKVYSTMGTVKLIAQNLPTLVFVALHFSPASITLLEPNKFELKATELQGILNDLSGFSHSLSMGILMTAIRKMGEKKK